MVKKGRHVFGFLLEQSGSPACCPVICFKAKKYQMLLKRAGYYIELTELRF
jgi:hypothetical protein